MEKIEIYPVLSLGYWKCAAGEFKNLRFLVFAAMITAASVALGSVFLPVGDNLRIKFTFLVQAAGAMIYGPLMGLLVGFASDILGFALFPSGPFFPGYTLSAMAACFIYGLLLYHKRVTVVRVLISRFAVNYLVNVGLGSLWSAMLYDKGYIFFFLQSLLKNSILLIPEVIVLVLLLRLLIPVFERYNVIPRRADAENKLPIW